MMFHSQFKRLLMLYMYKYVLHVYAGVCVCGYPQNQSQESYRVRYSFIFYYLNNLCTKKFMYGFPIWHSTSHRLNIIYLFFVCFLFFFISSSGYCCRLLCVYLTFCLYAIKITSIKLSLVEQKWDALFRYIYK